MLHPDYKCCKYCKSLNITIREPSSIQWCSREHIHVKKDDICDKFMFDEERVEFWKKAELGLFNEPYDESKDLTRHYASEIHD